VGSSSSVGETGVTASLPIVVRWAECDAAGIIFHGRVFDWFSEARVAWLEAVGLSYYQDVIPRGIELLVVHASADFRRPLRPGDVAVVEARVSRLTPARMHFTYRVRRDGVEVASGATHHGFVLQGKAGNIKKAHADLYRMLVTGALGADAYQGG